jgi:hypothetical protein
VTAGSSFLQLSARDRDTSAVDELNDNAFVLVLLCRNRFGTAFGLLRGSYPRHGPAGDLHAAVTGVAIHADEANRPSTTSSPATATTPDTPRHGRKRPAGVRHTGSMLRSVLAA